MTGDFVVEMGDIADEMYFISQGLVEIIATDQATPIAYLSEGEFFGEIGLLLTGTRSTSVKAKTISIFYVISKEDFLDVLERFPNEKEYLCEVGRTRLQTTNPEDLVNDDDNTIRHLMENRLLLSEIEEREILFDNDGKLTKMKSIANLSLQIREYKKRQKKSLPCNLTKHYPILDRFIIIPFSPLYYIWVGVTLLA